MEKPGEEACREGSWSASPLTLHLANLHSQEMHPTSKWGGGSHVVANFPFQVLLGGNILWAVRKTRLFCQQWKMFNQHLEQMLLESAFPINTGSDLEALFLPTQKDFLQFPEGNEKEARS